MAARSATPQPLWALVPTAARARYLRRTATAILDELEGLADALADTVGQPRTEAVLAELLPSVGGLHDLADQGPRVLRDRRLGRIPALRAGRRSLLVQAPRGTVAVRGGAASPWAEPVLETAAALLAGNAVVLSSPLGERVRAAFERGGVPPELLTLVPPGEDLGALAGHVVDTRPPGGKNTMLVLDGAPLDRAVTGALWAAFAGGGRHRAAVGRLVVVPSEAQALLPALVAGATRLRAGDPRRRDTEIGPLRSPETLARVEELVAEAVAEGATLLCGGPLEVPDVPGAFYAPAVLRGVPPDARILREPVPGPVLAVVEAADEDEAIALAKRAPAVSVWAGDRRGGERVARELEAGVAWVNEHGHSIPDAAVRLAGHVESRRIASQPTRLRSARWLPYDPQLVRAATASARLMHGRETERLSVLRTGAVPLARTAVRLAREALGR
jgi:acyl-CoA reductase-like NAD-dependent aldehyde dehydrogenase